ncbi:MAG TPA: methyltransferase domain-containing protein [Candidatus Binatia bacterium]|jgi:predicted nicotinamide N-methyase
MQHSDEKELMDSPGASPRLLEADLGNLRTLNRVLGAKRGIFKFLAATLDPNGMKEFSLLDVGTGSADIPIAIVEWARKRGLAARIAALEPHPVTAAVARRRAADYPEIAIIRADGFVPPFKPGSFDFVLASQVLHHFSEDQITTLLRVWAETARRALLVSDLVRHPLAYCGIKLLTVLFTTNQMTRVDAPLSVRRAFTVEEWRSLFRRAGVGPAEVLTLFPFRVFARLRLGRETL